jgi:hypothetical protein
VVDKAILLLNRKADISCRDENGDTVLHTLFKSGRLHERMSKIQARRLGDLQTWDLSFKAPKDLLMVFITAGADVYATNDDGETPSMVALEYGREDEWIEALELCGYESEEVLRLRCYIHNTTHEHQTSKLSFQEYCQQRQPQRHYSRFEEVQVDDTDADSECYDEDSYEEDEDLCKEDEDLCKEDEDLCKEDEDLYEEYDDREIRVIIDNTKRVDGGGNMEAFGGAECANYGMEIGLDNQGEKNTYNLEEMVDSQGPRVDDMLENNIEGLDVNLDDWLDNGMDFMQSFNDFGMVLDTPFE